MIIDFQYSGKERTQIQSQPGLSRVSQNIYGQSINSQLDLTKLTYKTLAGSDNHVYNPRHYKAEAGSLYRVICHL